MSDNVSNSTVATDVIAADDINGVKYQRVKLAVGSDGEYSGDVSVDTPLPTRLLNDSVVEINSQALTANTQYVSEGFNLVGSSYRVIASVDSVSVGNIKIALEITEDGINYENHYTLRHNISSGNTVINLPSLPISAKKIRYVLLSDAACTVTVTRNSFFSNARECRQFIYDTPTFYSLNDTTPVINISGLRMLTAVVSNTPTGTIKYVWEVSLDKVNWFAASATQSTSETAYSLLVGSAFSYLYGRLRVVSSTATSSPSTITLQGVS